MAVSFQNADVSFRLPDKAKLKKFIASSFEKHTGKKLSVSYVFCSDEYLLRMNQHFLQHDYYTDIITFPLSDSAKKTDAEIYISTDRVSENAFRLKTAFDKELLRVLFHGILHLMGYKDKTVAQKAQMRLAEENWIKEYGKM